MSQLFHNKLTAIRQGSFKALARAISLVENSAPGYEAFLQELPSRDVAVTGITGPPGAGKSTLVDALIEQLVGEGKKVGVICVDPSSPFNLGALLGDRIRMSQWYNHPNVFIRSLATRGSLGGLHPNIIEIIDVMTTAAFDHLIVETVGVGQSEIEIAGLADTTVVVLVPESGDEVQTMKAGLMEIADIFVVNKADRPGADSLAKNLRLMLMPASSQASWQIPVLKTVADQKQGVKELLEAIASHQQIVVSSERKYWLLAERAFHLIGQKKMRDVNKERLKEQIAAAAARDGFNLYTFIAATY